MFCKNECEVKKKKTKIKEEYNPTIESRYQKQIKYKGEIFSLEIIDTAGQVKTFIKKTTG
jgi:GTPase SAR1 family protein